MLLGRRSPSQFLFIFSIIVLSCITFVSCATTTYDREFFKIEDLYYAGKYDEAAVAVRELATQAGSRELLLYSMEAGIVFHTMGDYDASDRAFSQAWDISQAISRSKLEDVASFWLNETERKFIGQNFERVLIGYYRVLNQLARGNRENAKVLFCQIDAELRDMKYYDAFYKQNAVARYLDALVSLSLGDYNDSRAQIKNLSTLFPSWSAEWERFSAVLAVEENNADDMARTAQARATIPAFNERGERVPYRKGMACLLVLNSAGKSAVKSSRGTLSQTPSLMRSFETSLEANSQVKNNMSRVREILSRAENPIPEYARRDPAGSHPLVVTVNSMPLTRTMPLFSYSETALKHFNDNYSAMIERNFDALKAKLVGIMISGEAAASLAVALNTMAESQGNANRIDIDNARSAGTVIAAAEAYQKFAPDIRCWRFLPDNYQISVLYLEPGTYDVSFVPEKDGVSVSGESRTIEVGDGDFRFISLQSMSQDRRVYTLGS